MERLPSLNALRAFEAAARNASFTRAARELHVTQSAVSHQVRALEDELGAELFVRLPRALRLTSKGEALARGARDAFARIVQAAAEVAARPRLCVSVLPSFAACWLLPRLGRFQRAHPEIELRIHASQELADFARDGVDVAIRYGRGRFPGLHAEKLLDDEVFPVCSPRLAKRLRRPADLARFDLLHDDVRPAAHAGWPAWLRAARVRLEDGARGTSFSDAHLMLEAAAAGQGVALARSVLAEADLRSRRIVRPFAVSIRSRYSYFLVWPEGAGVRPEVRAFAEFIRAETAKA
jgi:LysR family transcriptional regulator, glycine cleavage system transcriptional activator